MEPLNYCRQMTEQFKRIMKAKYRPKKKSGRETAFTKDYAMGAP